MDIPRLPLHNPTPVRKKPSEDTPRVVNGSAPRGRRLAELVATAYRGVRAQRRPRTPHLGRHVAVLPGVGVEVGVGASREGDGCRRCPSHAGEASAGRGQRGEMVSWSAQIQIYPSSSAHPSRRQRSATHRVIVHLEPEISEKTATRRGTALSGKVGVLKKAALS
jgi:hypothetical protein